MIEIGLSVKFRIVLIVLCDVDGLNIGSLI